MRVVNAPKLIVDALLQRFLPLARQRLDTAQAQDGQYLRASDPSYEQVLDSLAMVAHHTPVPLLEALLKWRESEGGSTAQWGQPSDASTFQRNWLWSAFSAQLAYELWSAVQQKVSRRLSGRDLRSLRLIGSSTQTGTLQYIVEMSL